MEIQHTILVLNSGSSSLKFALYQLSNETEELIVTGKAERIGEAQGRLRMDLPILNLTLDSPRSFPDSKAALSEILDEFDRRNCPKPGVVGHRLINGGPDCFQPQRITAETLSKLRELVPLAPLHLPSEIALIETVFSRLPEIPQVACFDSAFHRTMPGLAQWLPLPRSLRGEGLWRYGFHGLSYEYVLQKLAPTISKKRLIMAHLGNGASLTAMEAGKPMETSMGFTPTGGVMMGTRTGDLDPGVLLYLLREKHYDTERLQALVDRQSGLLGVSEITADMKTLLEQRAHDFRAKEAVDLFCYLIRKQIGALTAVIGGLDALVFTGGVGEHASIVREEICKGLDYLGVHLDPARNETHQETISRAGSRCTVLVVPTNEELMIARHTRRAIS